MWGDTMDIKKAMQLYELRAYLEEKKAEQEVIEERYNKYHDPRNGRFTNGSGGGGGSALIQAWDTAELSVLKISQKPMDSLK